MDGHGIALTELAWFQDEGIPTCNGQRKHPQRNHCCKGGIYADLALEMSKGHKKCCSVLHAYISHPIDFLGM